MAGGRFVESDGALFVDAMFVALPPPGELAGVVGMELRVKLASGSGRVAS
jgi:hypothetical protein